MLRSSSTCHVRSFAAALHNINSTKERKEATSENPHEDDVDSKNADERIDGRAKGTTGGSRSAAKIIEGTKDVARRKVGRPRKVVSESATIHHGSTNDGNGPGYSTKKADNIETRKKENGTGKKTTRKTKKTLKRSVGSNESHTRDRTLVGLDGMTECENLQDDIKGFVKDNSDENIDEADSRAQSSRESDFADKRFNEWEKKSGLLFKPKHTGCPEADRISSHILKGYGGSGFGKTQTQGDTRRIHVVNNKLCGMTIYIQKFATYANPSLDDVLTRLGPSLEKHAGCDIIDLHPGPGVWSSAVHDILKPRTHILMEPDEELYKPLLQTLLDAKDTSYKLVPKSGLVWGHLNEVLNPEYLPHQRCMEQNDPLSGEPNNTLLFMANLGYYPRKMYRGFPSISTLFIYQLLGAARANSLFHKYGLIRMLVWVPDDEKHIYLPKNITYRKKGAIQAEVSCSDISEVASSTHHPIMGRREHSIDLESYLATLKTMQASGIEIPDGRAKPLQFDTDSDTAESQMSVRWAYLSELEDLEKSFAAGEFRKFKDTPEATEATKPKGSIRDFWTPDYRRLHALTAGEAESKRRGTQFGKRSGNAEELKVLRERFAKGEFSKWIIPESELPNTYATGGQEHWTAEYTRLYHLRNRSQSKRYSYMKYQRLFDEYGELNEMQKKLPALNRPDAAILQDEITQRIEDLKDGIQSLRPEEADQFLVQLDNRIAYHQDPPLLYWDRRKVEPLNVKATEFFPRHEMALLDFQPKALWPVLREDFPENYDIFEYIVSYLLLSPTQTVREGLMGLYNGAYEWLVAECPSLTDPSKGGNTDLDLLTVRCLTQEMYKEIMEAWMRWPFRPSRFDMMRRMGANIHDEGEDWQGVYPP